MGLLYGPRRAILGGKRPYFKKVLATGPIAYWPQWELTGSVSEDLVLDAQDGAYTGATLNATAAPDGSPSPFFDGVNDFNNVFTATLQGQFNGSEGSVAAWARVANAGVWTDGALRFSVGLRATAANRLDIEKDAANNRLDFVYVAGGAIRTVVHTPITDVGWMHLVMTWSASAGATGEMRAFLNGIQTGVTQINLGVWVGNLLNTRTNIGCDNTVGPASVWHGYLAHVSVWDRPLSPDEIANLAVV